MSLTDDELKLVGGSDVAAIVGVSPYANAFDIYSRIVEGTRVEDNKLFRRGRLMEPVIRAYAAEDYNLTLLGPRKLRPAEHLRVNLDDVHEGPDGEEAVEFKSVALQSAGRFGEGLTDIPDDYRCQVQFYCHAIGAPRARLYALLGLDDLRQYVIPSDEEEQGMILEAVKRFWVDHILPKRPPPIDASSSCAEWLARKYPYVEEETLPAGPEQEVWAQQLLEARRAKKAAEELEKEAANRFKEWLKEAGAVMGGGWKITYGKVKGSVKVDWEAIAAELNVPEDLIKKHTRVGEGFRSFRPKFAGEK